MENSSSDDSFEEVSTEEEQFKYNEITGAAVSQAILFLFNLKLEDKLNGNKEYTFTELEQFFKERVFLVGSPATFFEILDKLTQSDILYQSAAFRYRFNMPEVAKRLYYISGEMVEYETISLSDDESTSPQAGTSKDYNYVGKPVKSASKKTSRRKQKKAQKVHTTIIDNKIVTVSDIPSTSIDKFSKCASTSVSASAAKPGSSSLFHCYLCECDFESRQELLTHIEVSKSHAFEEYLESSYFKNLSHLDETPLSGKYQGITVVRCHLDNDSKKKKKKKQGVNILMLAMYKKTHHDARTVYLETVFAVHNEHNVILRRKKSKPNAALEKGGKQWIPLYIITNELGIHEYSLVFKFYYKDPYEVFYIVNNISVEVVCDNSINKCDDREVLTPTLCNVPPLTTSKLETQSNKPAGTRNRGVVFIDQRYNFLMSEQAEPLADDTSAENFCKVCKIQFANKEVLEIHKMQSGNEHAFKEVYMQCRNANSWFKNRPPALLSGGDYGVTIQSYHNKEGFTDYKINLLLPQYKGSKKEPSVSCNIILEIVYVPQNENNRLLYLANTFIVFGEPNITLKYKERNTKFHIKPGVRSQKALVINETNIGESIYIVAFKFFFGDNPEKEFFVMKRICVRVDSESTVDTPLNPKEETHDSARKAAKKKVERFSPKPEDFVLTTPPIIEQAERPVMNKGQLKFKKLKQFELPTNYMKFFNCGFNVNAKCIKPDMLQVKKNVLETLTGQLTNLNHDHFMSLLLYLEEHQTLCDLKTHSLRDAPLKKDKKTKFIVISVPGLAEDRPSVKRGDAIHLLVKGEGLYTGYVRHVEQTTVSVSMGTRFMSKFIDNMKASVYFTFNRSSLRYEHNAMELLKSNGQVKQVCFPTTYGKYKKDMPITCWFNRLVSQNAEQKQAVQNILNGTSMPAPYLLFGPPGTGKTVTLVETMAQIFQTPGNYILATAPSNAAADVVAERLIKILPGSQILRMYSPSREWFQVPDALKKISNFVDREVVFPALNELKKFRIIIATLICAGRLMRGNFPEGHFTHIFVDECGHGMEPTALVPVAGLLGREPKPGQLVLSGDPKQLGPIIRSPVAKQLGLGLSLLERLMTSCDLYQKTNGNYNSLVLTKLVKNFRSHPSILKIPNELFYDGELQACGEMGMTYSLCEWDRLVTKGVPVIFHGIEGQETKDEGTPSLYNIAEVNLVVQYVEQILVSKIRGQRLRPSDIGVISPYRAQLTKLHRALGRKNINNIHELTVGSVEEFQGQERRVIIISTVRSNPAQVCLDRKYRLGFVKEPKRFNVALTRAKALVIIIGNPSVLETDVNWRRLLEWSIQLGAYKGCKFNLSPAPQMSVETEEEENEEETVCPIKERLQQQLALCKDALQHQIENANKWKPDTDVDLIMEQIKMLGFLSVPSTLENMVSPPFSTFEQ